MKDDQDVSARKLVDRLVPDAKWGTMRGFFSTTYELGPDFFEMDFLPSVFGLGAWDDRSWTTRIALEKRLFELDAAVVLTEARRYRRRPRSLRLDVRPAVSPRGASLHAKITLLLFDSAVRLIVGSANLTDRGYRQNREVVAVLTASQGSKKDAVLIHQALAGAEAGLDHWLTAEARTLIRRSIETLRPWINSESDSGTTFVWSYGQSKLWKTFLSRWPSSDVVKRISILSPFWSVDAALTLTALLEELKRTNSLASDAEVRLLTDAFEGANGQVLPILPPGYANHDWAKLGVKVFAQAVSPKVHPAELGGMKGFTGSRALHAKVVLMEGMKSGLAYLGSANFTAHGWGFLNSQTPANVEAGLILRRSGREASFNTLMPDLAGQPVLLTSGNFKCLQPPEDGPADDPWPEFIRQVLLSPAAVDESELELLIEIEPGTPFFPWSAKLASKDSIPDQTLIQIENASDATPSALRLRLSPPTLTRLLTEQEITICWSECPFGRPVPLNVEFSARARLPIAPGNPRIEENSLLWYYQGRISWEELFPDPEVSAGQSGGQLVPSSPDAGVDKSRIQSYQIREFVEALAGLGHDLRAATRSDPCMRMALLGPVSPFALAQTVLEAVKSGSRTPTAAGFQLVEILACLQSARAFTVPEKLSPIWASHLADVTNKIAQLLKQIVASHAEDLGSNKAFRNYRKAVLAGDARLEK